MKKVIFAAAVSVLCLLSGCSRVETQIETDKSSQVQEPSSEHIYSDETKSLDAVSNGISGSDGISNSGAESMPFIEASSAEASEKSDRIVLVGDSRTMQLGNYLYGMTMINNRLVDEATPDGDYILGAGGEGYAWLLEHTEYIEDKLTEGCALVVNMGVNGAPDFHSEIAAWCNRMAEKYKDVGVKVYFMSVNPVNDALLRYYNYIIRNVDVIYFNSAIRTELKGVTYLDTYSVVTDDILGDGSGTYDGLHYYESVYRKIRDHTWEIIKN